MTQRLQNKRALVTAAGNGIGLASALAMAREGAEVWATDINQDALAQLARQAQAEGLAGLRTRVLDVLDTQAVQACAQEIGALDALFNCAGHVHAGNILECPESDWDFAMDLNAKSMHRTIRAFLPAMLERGGGSIINMSSAASSVKGVPNRYAYGASKAAVIGLTKAVAADFVARGIRCNAICPGTIESPRCATASPRRRRRHRRRDRARRLRGPPAHRPRRPRRGSRGAGGLPGQRRIRLHHRHHPGHRRRLVQLTPPRSCPRLPAPDFPHHFSTLSFRDPLSSLPYSGARMKLVRYGQPGQENPASSTPRARCATCPAWSPTSAAPRWRLNRWPASPRWMRPRCRALTASRATAARWPASARSSAWA